MNIKEFDKIKNPQNKPRVLHLVKVSLPNISGHSIRSHSILLNQKKFVIPYALTYPYFENKNPVEVIDGVRYYRYPFNHFTHLFYYSKFSTFFQTSKVYDYLYQSVFKIPLKYINNIVKSKSINLIHGHSPEGFASLGEIIAHKRNIPFVYELRGFYEDSRVGNGTLKINDPKYLKIIRKENNLMRKADVVVTLGKMMKKELINRGINKKKIFIVPNGVDTNYFKPEAPNIELKKLLGINNNHIVTFIGNIRRIEGIETLVKAMDIVRKKIKNVKLLLIGKCRKDYRLELERLIKKLRIDELVYFLGLIPFKNIKSYYSIVDLVIIPRIDSRVNRLVTPLKPLEAMAMKKVVITSDLPALRESIKPGISGDVFKPDNPNDLARKIMKYLTDNDKKSNLANSARDFVEKNYDWSILIKKYKILYEKVQEL